MTETNEHGVRIIQDVMVYPSGRISFSSPVGPLVGTRQELKQTIEAIVRAIQLTDPPA